MKRTTKLSLIVGGIILASASVGAMATCSEIKTRWNATPNIMSLVVGLPENGGYGLPMWATLVDETGKVCAVYNSSTDTGSTIGNHSWLGSRVISMQKANTANAFSLDGFAISTANLYGLTQPGGSLYGLQASNPVDSGVAYYGPTSNFGKDVNDPAVGKRIGGVNVFGGGLALYVAGRKVGAIGVSGDTSCTDHVVAWKLRALMLLDNVPGGFISDYAGTKPLGIKGDAMIIKINNINNLNIFNTYKQPSCAHNSISDPSAATNNATLNQAGNTGVILE